MLRINPSGRSGTKEILVQSIAREVRKVRGTKRGRGLLRISRIFHGTEPSVQTDMSDLVEHGKNLAMIPRKCPVEMLARCAYCRPEVFLLS